MAEVTLKDVLNAIGEMRSQMATGTDVARLQADVARLEADVARLDAKVDAHRAETDAHRAETKNGFNDLDKELTGHAALHREIEKDIEALKSRPARTAARATRRTRTR